MRRLGVAIAAFLALVVVTVAILLGSLDRPWMKRRIEGAARAATGLDLDYRSLRIRLFSGVQLEGVVVRTPPELRALAPDLARLERLEARWSLSSLLGRGPKVERVAVDGLAVAIAEGARGRTSLDLLGPSGAPKAAPPKPAASPLPLSHLLAQALGSAPPVGEIDISRVECAWVSAKGGIVQRDSLAGVGLHVSVSPAGKGWKVQVEAGSQSTPLELDVRRDGSEHGDARLALWVSAQADPAHLSLAADLRVRQQSLVPVQVAEVLHLEAGLYPDPARGRTEAKLERLVAADGAVDLAADAIVPDAESAAPSVRSAQGTADLAHVLRIIPAGLVPLVLERGTLRFRIANLEAGAGAPRLEPGGAVHLEADLSNLRIQLPHGESRLAAMKLGADAQPKVPGGLEGHLSLDLHGLELRQPGQDLRAQGVAVGAKVEVAEDARWTGLVRLGVASLEVAGPTRLSLRNTDLEVHARSLHVEPTNPLGSSGDVDVGAKIGACEVRVPGSRVVAANVGLQVRAPLSGRAPFAADVQISADRLQSLGGGGRPLVDAPARLTVKLADVYPDQVRPVTSRARAQVSVDLGAVRASVDAEKRREAIDFDVALNASSLMPLRPWLPPPLAHRLRLGKTTLAFRTHGHADKLASTSPSLREETKLELAGLAFDRDAARNLTLSVRSNGDAWRHSLDLDLALAAVSVGDRALGDEEMTLALTVDRRQPSLNLTAHSKGLAGAELTLSAGVEGRERRIGYDLHAHLDQLGPLRRLSALVPVLDELDLSRSALKLDAQGALTGIIAKVDHAGQLRFEPHPIETVAGDGNLALGIDGVRLHAPGQEVALASATVNATFKGRGARRDLHSEVHLDGLHLVMNDQKLALGHLDEALQVSLTGDPKTGQADLTSHLVLRQLAQNAAPFIPTDEVSVALAASRDREGLVHLSSLRVEDPGAGTHLALSGGAELGEERRRVSLQAQLEQELGKLKGLPGSVEGTGRVRVDVKVESPDLEVFHTRAGLVLDDVHLRVRPAGIAVDSVDAQIPISLDLLLGPHGLTLPHEETVNPYAALRFADQQPLMNRNNFLSVGRLATPFVTIAPLAGNLEIDQNIVSLGQLEMGVRGGHVTGECALDWNGWDSKIEAHVRASGVQSSHGEPFDGDAALVVSAGDRTIDGRAQILRIGKRHLLDLLDLQDPHHVNAAMNRIRYALAFGYPDQVRLAFDHGFASARITLGGLARLIRIDEIRGIPTGSLIDKIFASSSTPESAP